MRILETIGDRIHFEFFGEDLTPPLADLTDRPEAR
jgi:hypothetical protein